MQEQIIKLGDVAVNYKVFESEDTVEDIVILHGWGGKGDSWIEVGKLLSQYPMRVIIPDLPGFGKTEIIKEYTLDDYAELIEEFCSKLDLKNIILWGHSNGGAISITLENRGKLEIERLVLNNSAGIRKDEKRSFKRTVLNTFAKVVKKIVNKVGGESIRTLQDNGKENKISKIRSLFYRAIGSQDYLEAEKNPFLKQTYLNMIGSDLQEQIENIDTDTLLLRGEKDTYTPVSDAHIMRRLIKKSKIVVLDNETHGIHLKNPERLVQTFIDNI